MVVVILERSTNFIESLVVSDKTQVQVGDVNNSADH